MTAPSIAERWRKYAPTPMPADLTGLDGRRRRLVRALLRAAALADEIFWRQTGPLAVPYRGEMRAAYPESHELRRFYLAQTGPYDRLDDDAPFLDVPPKPPGAGFYPPDLTEEELVGWIDGHPEQRDAFLSPYTVVQRREGGLVAVPYHVEYAELLGPMAEALGEAAGCADDPELRRCLELRAEAVLTDDYYEADLAWTAYSGEELDLVLGPYEVYEDHLMNLKAAFEASVELVDREESRKLALYERQLQALEDALPYPEELKPESAESRSTFTIVRDVYRGGLLRTGYQAVAANLPNDSRVKDALGTKKTFWKNVLDARFERIIGPVGRRMLVETQQGQLDAGAFFEFVLLHEMAHGLGPRYAGDAADRVPLNRALREHYSWIEENKADMAGLLGLRLLGQEGVLPAGAWSRQLTSYLASLFRTVRFGTAEAHGRAAVVSLNWFLERGGVRVDAGTGRFEVEPEPMEASIRSLAHELLMIEATGDRDRAAELAASHGRPPEVLERALERLGELPVDLVPVYEIRW